jgi:hypothetical protein
MVDAFGAVVDEASGPGAVDAADFTTGSVIQSDLMAFSVGSHAQKDAAIKGPIDCGLQVELEILKPAQSGEQTSLSGRALHTHNGTIFNDPLTGKAMTGEVVVASPAGQVLTVEQ